MGPIRSSASGNRSVQEAEGGVAGDEIEVAIEREKRDSVRKRDLGDQEIHGSDRKEEIHADVSTKTLSLMPRLLPIVRKPEFPLEPDDTLQFLPPQVFLHRCDDGGSLGLASGKLHGSLDEVFGKVESRSHTASDSRLRYA